MKIKDNIVSFAYSPRNHLAIRFRRLRFKLISKLAKTSSISNDSIIAEIVIHPYFKTKLQAEVFLKKLDWYLPPDLFPDLLIFYLIKQSKTANQRDSRYIRLEQNDYSNKLKTTRFILRHHITLWNTFGLFFKGVLPVTTICDPNLFSTVESQNMKNLSYQLLSAEKKKELDEISRDNYKRLKDTYNSDSITLFLSGPSLDEYNNYNYENSLSIICNSIVKNQDLLDHVDPKIVTFADPVFHYSWNQYASKFREDVSKFLSREGTFCVIPKAAMALLWGHFKQFREQLIGVEIKSNNIFESDPSSLIFPRFKSILTIIMFPLAISLGNEIRLIGADGRKPDENYFWTHSKANQYNELMEIAFNAHPSFFRDRNYIDFYDEYCKELAQEVDYAEHIGKIVESLTNSYIPALSSKVKKNN